MLLGKKKEKILSALSSTGYPLRQPVNNYVKSPILGRLSQQSLCVLGKEREETHTEKQK